MLVISHKGQPLTQEIVNTLPVPAELHHVIIPRDLALGFNVPLLMLMVKITKISHTTIPEIMLRIAMDQYLDSQPLYNWDRVRLMLRDYLPLSVDDPIKQLLTACVGLNANIETLTTAQWLKSRGLKLRTAKDFKHVE